MEYDAVIVGGAVAGGHGKERVLRRAPRPATGPTRHSPRICTLRASLRQGPHALAAPKALLRDTGIAKPHVGKRRPMRIRLTPHRAGQSCGQICEIRPGVSCSGQNGRTGPETRAAP
jgi:hypothetical protein